MSAFVRRGSIVAVLALLAGGAAHTIGVTQASSIESSRHRFYDNELRIAVVRHVAFPQIVRTVVVEMANPIHQDLLDRFALDGRGHVRRNDQRNFTLFSIASNVGFNRSNSACGATKIMKTSEPSCCGTVISQSRSGCAFPCASGNGEGERR